MNVTHPIADKVLARLRSVPGTAVPAGDFLDLLVSQLELERSNVYVTEAPLDGAGVPQTGALRP